MSTTRSSQLDTSHLRCCQRLLGPAGNLLTFLLIEHCPNAQLKVVRLRHRGHLEPNLAVLHQREHKGRIPRESAKLCHEQRCSLFPAPCQRLLQERSVAFVLPTLNLADLCDQSRPFFRNQSSNLCLLCLET